jgi:hypothetical protein
MDKFAAALGNAAAIAPQVLCESRVAVRFPPVIPLRP